MGNGSIGKGGQFSLLANGLAEGRPRPRASTLRRRRVRARAASMAVTTGPIHEHECAEVAAVLRRAGGCGFQAGSVRCPTKPCAKLVLQHHQR